MRGGGRMAAAPALAAADGGQIKKQRAGLPRLLHKFFIKVLRLRPASAAEAEFYGYRMAGAAAGAAGSEEEYCYYYSYGGGSGSSWAGVLSSIPEEEDDSSEDGTPDIADAGPAAVLRKAQSERFIVGQPGAAAVVHVEVLLS